MNARCVRGPDGAYYVGALTGAPFFVGEAKVYRVVRGEAPTVFLDSNCGVFPGTGPFPCHGHVLRIVP